MSGRWVPPEINQPQPGAILLVGRDADAEDEHSGKPFSGLPGRLLEDCLREAGLRRKDVNIANVCLAEGTRVLTEDLRWVPIESVQIGDRLFAFDEHGGSRGGTTRSPGMRRWRIAEVTATNSQEKECFEITTAHGTLRATADHKVLTMLARSGGSTNWTSVGHLYYKGTKARASLAFVFAPEERTVEDYYLQGLFDGEGTLGWSRVSNKQEEDVGLRVSFSQRLNNVRLEGKYALIRRGYAVSEHIAERTHLPNQKPNAVVRVAGHRAHTIRFLSLVRGRMLENFLAYMIERTPPIARFIPSRVEGKRSIGVQRVYDLTTTTGTFIAEGFAVHNCGVRPPANEFGAHRRVDVERGVDELQALVQRLKPSIVVSLGNEASYALVSPAGSWPSRTADIFGATGIEDRRGYLWDGISGVKVLSTIHPAAAARQWVPWRILLASDLKKAKAHSYDGPIRRPRREVEIVTSEADARRAVSELGGCRRLGADIETIGTSELACVGFAGESGRAFVFPAKYLDGARSLLESDRVGKVFQNGQYDLYFLLTRCGVRVGGYRDDTILAWHSCYPELAGKSISDSKKSKRTQKSLAFLSSLYTADAYWKDYEFASEEERYILNGRDCCVTLDCMTALDAEMKRLGVRRIYEHAVGLVWPCVEMQARGMRVDDSERRRRIMALSARIDEGAERLSELVVPLVEREQARLQPKARALFHNRSVCVCCRNGKGKREECWACAGFEKKPGKRALAESGRTLAPCAACEGAGAREWYSFNPRSHDQIKIVLYDLLRLPKRFKDGRLTTDEGTLKDALAHVNL